MQKKKRPFQLKLELGSTCESSPPHSPVQFLTARNKEIDKFASESPHEAAAITDRIINKEPKRSIFGKKKTFNLNSDRIVHTASKIFGKTQINSPVMKAMLPAERSKIIQAACGDPAVYYNYMSRKLFVKDLESASPLLIEKNKIEKAANSTDNLFNRTQEFAYGKRTSGFEKERLIKRHKDFFPKTPVAKTKRIIKNPKCETIDLIIKTCDDAVKIANTLQKNSKEEREKLMEKNYSEKMTNFSNALKSGEIGEGNIVEKLHECFQRGNKIEDGLEIVYKGRHTSLADVRKHNAKIHKLLKRYKNKILK
ncbi:unnamed protein product [Blepharisma stoltei]|uniref:Uncharacterized protein n=1 Tax=Blepharisma stoltei TaxID=1481888 RepID=A0AAU9JDC5_9CILI|nr:unnamed protein product [Blepharisma stoltei]